ncbi:hypothetical protein HBH56_018760 [Parastagonospora nodorum]|uniref:Putative peptidase domain-containing protein n=2 Tax=Phaeosphaeria nodorum (strain SN15 / ATCC MYA-4574 / FGSC 10173) TaxID=321614 RepID=A0A7U2I0W5_PHANO|nr:hypothetical protein SNOG_02996 [Parastagonospora nodorum SN15]KAH3919786.1 hypothetical protein HBH56_018760 [Parastagonospora nodorum]EAT89727.1 hypothetical protein SNOG_02996 [Parastagonospora nodorum SN15]KAH3936865.1 hypothetical protein HBH54_015730 [Parastagonospora nodorum]KAH3953862.1 hypothetical protein HBH53_027900 [Parastagonospora nodorum]KAH3962666.1 hypothetical protein HBH51_173920 [Parastagonospora nodorum]
MVAYSSLVLLGASAAVANPIFPRQAAASSAPVAAVAPASTAWDAGAVNEYPIHASCNATQKAYIKKGLQETETIARHARDHILRWGNSSAIYKKYFGDAATGEPAGWFAKIADGDKAGVVFRCDDPDQNCATQKGWAGHWRGANASSETVICDVSYETRRSLEGLCGFGWTVATGATNFYWAGDLLHRLLHIPKVGEGVVEHYSVGKYPGVLELAKENSTYAVRDSDTLQYFALEAYAQDIAVPGVGCAGKYTATSSSAAAASTSRAASVSAAPASASATPTRAAATSAAATSTKPAQAAQSCTPHDDHWHCPPGVPEPAGPPA